mmetsp:Transcript_58866/g.172278  ORF Transcript_58866/g.172278 Transcript_58866/m.172278 type:complete len:456 (-) Transcript_58866:128-1495(-)
MGDYNYAGGEYGQEATAGAYSMLPTASGGAARKIFVGSLPDGITDAVIRDEFGRYGLVEDIFIKANCEPGRMWAFVSFSTPDQAATAISMTNGVLQFPGSMRPCEVTLARHQGMFGQDPLVSAAPSYQSAPQDGSYSEAGMSDSQLAPKKIFVGSLPDSVTDPVLREEFGKYGQILDVFMKTTCEPGRQWAFITFANSEQAQFARNSCNKVLTFPGSERPCEVTMARHQGQFGKDPIEPKNPGMVPTAGGQYMPQAVPEGPKKVFVGSLPDTITDQVLRSEFSKYGQIIDLFLKTTCEPGRQWAFITFAASEEARYAKEATDRVLMFPGSERTCEVMLAKNQGKFGQAPLNSFGGGAPQEVAAQVPQATAFDGPQPPPPTSPPPAHLTPWRMYRTASGLPYYHNSATGVTQWECPPDFQVPGQPEALSAVALQQAQGGIAYNTGAVAGQQRYSPY